MRYRPDKKERSQRYCQAYQDQVEYNTAQFSQAIKNLLGPRLQRLLHPDEKV